MLTDTQAIELSRSIENINIDVKKTIEKAVKAGYLGEEHFYSTVIHEGAFTYPVTKVLGDSYPTIGLDNLYFDVLSKALDMEGIYISLAYCNGEMRISNDSADEVIEYDEYELEEDELYYQRQFVLITADSTKIFKIYEEEGISAHNPTEDIGLMVKYVDGKYKSYFAVRSTDLCMSALRILPLSENYPKEHELSIFNPINKILMEMIRDTIVLDNKKIE